MHHKTNEAHSRGNSCSACEESRIALLRSLPFHSHHSHHSLPLPSIAKHRRESKLPWILFPFPVSPQFTVSPVRIAKNPYTRNCCVDFSDRNPSRVLENGKESKPQFIVLSLQPTKIPHNPLKPNWRIPEKAKGVRMILEGQSHRQEITISGSPESHETLIINCIITSCGGRLESPAESSSISKRPVNTNLLNQK